MNKWIITSAVFVLLTITAGAQTPEAKAAQILQQARAAIGTETQLKALKSLSVSITSRRTIGGINLERDLEYDILLPDKVRRRESRQPFTTITVLQDENAVTYSVPNPINAGGDLLRENSSAPQAQARRRADFARMLLGLLLTTPFSERVEYTYAGEHKEPDGTAEMIDVKGPEGFAARLYIEQQTHRFLALSYRDKQLSHAVRAMARLTGNASQRASQDNKKLTPEQQAQRQVERWAELEKRRRQFEEALAQAPEVEYRWVFSDHKAVKGLTLPHRLTRTEAGQEYEEWEVNAFKLNPKLSEDIFGIKKK
ncbi:MAG TPA: hypothetical protein VFZ34_32505 [Blastocatellia bacterium]|nr:hypothetical protein [Blastocatellia bacterium]